MSNKYQHTCQTNNYQYTCQTNISIHVKHILIHMSNKYQCTCQTNISHLIICKSNICSDRKYPQTITQISVILAEKSLSSVIIPIFKGILGPILHKFFLSGKLAHNTGDIESQSRRGMSDIERIPINFSGDQVSCCRSRASYVKISIFSCFIISHILKQKVIL